MAAFNNILPINIVKFVRPPLEYIEERKWITVEFDVDYFTLDDRDGLFLYSGKDLLPSCPADSTDVSLTPSCTVDYRGFRQIGRLTQNPRRPALFSMILDKDTIASFGDTIYLMYSPSNGTSTLQGGWKVSLEFVAPCCAIALKSHAIVGEQ